MFTLIYHIHERPTDSKQLKSFIITVKTLALLLVVILYCSQIELNFPTEAQVSKHSIISNGVGDITFGKIQALDPILKVKIAKGTSNASGMGLMGINHSIGELRKAQKLVHQERHLVQSKLRKVLGQIIPHQYIVVLKDEIKHP